MKSRNKDDKTRLEKLDRKYGSSYLRKLSKATSATKTYYELYLESQRQARIDAIECYVFYLLAFISITLSLWVPLVLFMGAIFLIIATQAALNARIERVWSAKFIDNMFDSIRLFNLEEDIHELKKEVKNERDGK